MIASSIKGMWRLWESVAGPVQVIDHTQIGSWPSIFSNRSTHQVALNLSSEKCEVTTEDPERSSKAKETISAKYQGEELRIGYNAEYLKDIVSHVQGETIKIRLGSPVTAALFSSSKDRENEENTMLLMPIRLNNWL